MYSPPLFVLATFNFYLDSLTWSRLSSTKALTQLLAIIINKIHKISCTTMWLCIHIAYINVNQLLCMFHPYSKPGVKGNSILLSNQTINTMFQMDTFHVGRRSFSASTCSPLSLMWPDNLSHISLAESTTTLASSLQSSACITYNVFYFCAEATIRLPLQNFHTPFLKTTIVAFIIKSSSRKQIQSNFIIKLSSRKQIQSNIRNMAYIFQLHRATSRMSTNKYFQCQQSCVNWQSPS